MLLEKQQRRFQVYIKPALERSTVYVMCKKQCIVLELLKIERFQLQLKPALEISTAYVMYKKQYIVLEFWELDSTWEEAKDSRSSYN